MLWSSVGTVKEAVHVLMAGKPHGVDTARVLERLSHIPHVIDVHDFHVWTLSGDMNNMWAHLTVEPGADSTAVLNAAQAIAKSVQCSHCCFQVEDSGTYDRSVEVHHQCCMAGEVKSPRQSVNVD